MNLLANNSILGHDLEVLGGNDISVTRGSDKHIRAGSSFLHCRDFITSHCSLKSVDGVDFRNDDASTIRPQ